MISQLPLRKNAGFGIPATKTNPAKAPEVFSGSPYKHVDVKLNKLQHYQD